MSRKHHFGSHHSHLQPRAAGRSLGQLAVAERRTVVLLGPGAALRLQRVIPVR